MVSLDIPVRICREIHRSSGITGLWTPGLSATVCREILYSGCTKGIYPLARTAISGGKHASDITLTERALAAACTPPHTFSAWSGRGMASGHGKGGDRSECAHLACLGGFAALAALAGV